MKKQYFGHVGFTLIELLVVIALVMVLSAMLFPVLGRIQEQGRSVQCVNNLKQLYVAASSHVNNNNGNLPYSASAQIWGLDPNGVFKPSGWVTGWVASYPKDTANMKSYWWEQDGSNGTFCIRNGSLFPYIGTNGDESVYICPTMRRELRSKAGNKIVVRSYGMNNALTNRLNDIDGLSRRIMFADQGYANVGRSECLSLISGGRSDPNPTSANSSPYYQRFSRAIDGSIDSQVQGTAANQVEYIGELHGNKPGANSGMANAIFCDGHVESIKYVNTDFVCSGAWENGVPVQ